MGGLSVHVNGVSPLLASRFGPGTAESSLEEVAAVAAALDEDDA